LFRYEAPNWLFQRIEVAGFALALVGVYLVFSDFGLKISELRSSAEDRRIPAINEYFSIIDRAGRIGASGEIGQSEALERLNKMGVSLSNVDLSGIPFRDIDLRQGKFCKTNFSEARFHKVDFRHSHLNDADFSGAILEKVYFSTTNNSGINFSRAKIQEDLQTHTDSQIETGRLGQPLRVFDFYDTNFDQVQFKWKLADIPGARVSYSTMKESDFEKTVFPISEFVAIDMTGANFQESNLAGSIFARGSCGSGDGAGCLENPADYDLKISNTVFRGANVTGADFRSVKYTDPDFLSEACYSEKGVHLDIVAVGCTPNGTPKKYIRRKFSLNGPPLVPEGVNVPQTCNGEKDQHVDLGTYFISAEWGEPIEQIVRRLNREEDSLHDHYERQGLSVHPISIQSSAVQLSDLCIGDECQKLSCPSKSIGNSAPQSQHFSEYFLNTLVDLNSIASQPQEDRDPTCW
jgi:uncharacterized protein YjbI with pentapeptide repeats